MTSIFHSPEPPRRSRRDFGIAAVCVATIAVGALVSRWAITCGVSHGFFFQALGMIVMGVSQALIGETRYDVLLVNAIAYALDVGVFFMLVRAWYRRASADRYLIGVLGITAVYLVSYAVRLPGVCP